ncbi:MAG: sigma-70 family RNA polymerase sigma factor [Chloroflexi bacterium]|nr:MAG: sigma-70 family RNA polymerase sigma factor [Chloroflexota bacterium]TME56293.1 MAG: sigma-70 family RNA polymerase sigma factor [Chloroflexota bacterium]
MLNRWFFAPRSPSGSNGGEHNDDDSPVKEADFIVLPAAASDSWRTWLMTGIRKRPFDRRRVRGANKGLKKMLVEGTPPNDGTLPWNDFSSAMVRQSVDEALNTLPAGHKQAVKLAYFGGLTNEEIAEHLGIGEGAVRRKLREALRAVSAHVEMGRAAARRTIYAFAGWFAARSILDTVRRGAESASDHAAQVAVVVACGAVTAGVLASQAPSPAQLTQVDRGRISAAAPASLPTKSLPINPVTAPVTVPTLPDPTSVPVSVPVPPVKDPVDLPNLPIKLPHLLKLI